MPSKLFSLLVVNVAVTVLVLLVSNALG